MPKGIYDRSNMIGTKWTKEQKQQGIHKRHGKWVAKDILKNPELFVSKELEQCSLIINHEGGVVNRCSNMTKRLFCYEHNHLMKQIAEYV